MVSKSTIQIRKIQVYGKAKTQKIIKSLISKTIKLEEYPKMGQVEQEISLKTQQEVRYLISGHCKVLYKIIEEKGIVLILTVFDTRQDPSKMLSEE